MDDYELNLTCADMKTQVCPKLYLSDKESELLTSVKISKKDVIYREKRYSVSFAVKNNITISDVKIFVNDREVVDSDENPYKYNHESGCFHFHNGKNEQYDIFNDFYGFVKISLLIEIDGNYLTLETDYLQVMVKEGEDKFNKSVDKMVEYISKYNSNLLNDNNPISRSLADLNKHGNRTLEFKILLLKKFIMILKHEFCMFSAEAKFKTIPGEYVDSFDKLQYVSLRTIQYISQHPEYLEEVYTPKGIKIQNKFYQPTKTLVTNSVQSFDIYENRCIIGFIKAIIKDISKTVAELESVKKKNEIAPIEKEGYISSYYYLYTKSKDIINKRLNVLNILQEKYHELLASYTAVFKIESKPIMFTPNPTHIFISVSHYRQIYNCISTWFDTGEMKLGLEETMLSMNMISALYESYVLLKILNFFINYEYKLVGSYKKKYDMQGYQKKELYINTLCDNCYVFKRGGSCVTVYYQPVIFSGQESIDREAIQNNIPKDILKRINSECLIGLYRNTSMPAYKPKDGGLFYTPDYLIKYEFDDSAGAKYLIADAKFSELKTVKSKRVKDLVFKYLFSISPFKKDDRVVSLCVINGLSKEERDEITSIYDFAPDPDSIVPNANILTLTENEGNDIAWHDFLMKKIFGKFI